MMTASTSDRQRRLINEARRLHMAIVEWGQKHGVWAYRVMTTNKQWFEIWNPNTKTLSRNFPGKIQTAIALNAEALKIYADDTRMRDAKADTERSRPMAPPRGRFCRWTDKQTRPTVEVSERE